MVCCGVWLMHDWMGSMVLDNCYDHNYHQINNLTEPFIRHMEENCYDYPRDSISCKMMLITPVFILILILLFLILLSVCACVTCVRLKRLQRYHDFQTSQGFDSSGTEETTDGADPVLEKKKQLEVWQLNTCCATSDTWPVPTSLSWELDFDLAFAIPSDTGLDLSAMSSDISCP